MSDGEAEDDEADAVWQTIQERRAVRYVNWRAGGDGAKEGGVMVGRESELVVCGLDWG